MYYERASYDELERGSVKCVTLVRYHTIGEKREREKKRRRDKFVYIFEVYEVCK